MINFTDSIVVSAFDLDLNTREYSNRLLGASDFANSFSIENEKIYDVALDQSNTCTGMTIRSVNEDRLVILELINNGVDFTIYRNVIVNLLKKILVSKRIRYFLMEEPLGYITGQRNRELTRLKKVLIDFVEHTRGLNISKFDTTAPQTWRSGLIGKDNPEPKNSKLACVYEIIKLYPETASMRSHRKKTGTDYDGFESCGILCGYINKHAITSTNDLVKIVGPINTPKQGFGIFTDDSEKLQQVVDLITKVLPKLGKPKVKYYNESKTVYENVKMSLVDDFTVSVITSRLAIVSLKHLFKEKIGEGQMIMVVIPAASLRENFIKAVLNTGVNCEIFY